MRAHGIHGEVAWVRPAPCSYRLGVEGVDYFLSLQELFDYEAEQPILHDWDAASLVFIAHREQYRTMKTYWELIRHKITTRELMADPIPCNGFSPAGHLLPDLGSVCSPCRIPIEQAQKALIERERSLARSKKELEAREEWMEQQYKDHMRLWRDIWETRSNQPCPPEGEAADNQLTEWDRTFVLIHLQEMLDNDVHLAAFASQRLAKLAEAEEGLRQKMKEIRGLTIGEREDRLRIREEQLNDTLRTMEERVEEKNCEKRRLLDEQLAAVAKENKRVCTSRKQQLTNLKLIKEEGKRIETILKPQLEKVASDKRAIEASRRLAEAMEKDARSALQLARANARNSRVYAKIKGKHVPGLYIRCPFCLNMTSLLSADPEVIRALTIQQNQFEVTPEDDAGRMDVIFPWNKASSQVRRGSGAWRRIRKHINQGECKHLPPGIKRDTKTGLVQEDEFPIFLRKMDDK